MSATTTKHPASAPRSPWSGSQHQTRHRWQLELVDSLESAAVALRALAAELRAAHHAGWHLVEPMRGGHLLAARPSRRQRAGRDPGVPATTGPVSAPSHPWRLRVVEDRTRPPGADAFDAHAAAHTPVLTWDGDRLAQVSGPATAPAVLAEVLRQVSPTGLSSRLWGIAPARVGPALDLVAHGSALRLHTVQDGALVRTFESLPFQHGADGASTLLQAAAAYDRLARAADAMTAAGGLLADADDGFLHISYPSV